MILDFNDLLRKEAIDPKDVNAVRHSPAETALRKALPLLASERRDLFDHYQSTQGERVENQFLKRSHLASFVATHDGRSVFAGMYERTGSTWIDWDDYWRHPLTRELVGLGQYDEATAVKRTGFHLFQFTLLSAFSGLIGRLTIDWPLGSRSWVRIAGNTPLPIRELSEENLLVGKLKDWREVDFGFSELFTLPNSWRDRMSQWRGIYLITDRSDGKQYVGSAYGEDNILGRWLDYAKTGHGGNMLLRSRQPSDFQFSVLELVSPETEPDIVVNREEQWKKRLRTREFGLNDN